MKSIAVLDFVKSLTYPSLLIDWSSGDLYAYNESVTTEYILGENKLGKNWLCLGIWDNVSLVANAAEHIKIVNDKQEVVTRIKKSNGTIEECCNVFSLISIEGINYLLCSFQKVNNNQNLVSNINDSAQQDILYTVLFAAEQFFKGSLLKNAIRTFLEKVGKVTKVDCVYIFPVNDPDLVGIDKGQRLEWTRVGDHIRIQGFTLNFFLPKLLHQLSNQKIVFGIRKDFVEDQQNKLDAYSIASMAVFPLIVNNKLWGIIGFEHQSKEYEWNEKDIQPLMGCANILSAAIQNEHNRRLLRDSEQEYKAVIEDQTELICRWKPDGVITFCNNAFLRYFECRELSEIEGKNIDAFFVPGEDINIRQHISKLSEKIPSTTISFKLKLLSDDKWMQTTIRALFEEGMVSGYQSVSRDLTELITAEEAARSSEIKYGLLFNKMMDGFLLISVREDGKSNRYLDSVDANQALLNIVGSTSNEISPSKPLNKLIPEMGPQWEKTIIDVYDSKKAKRYEGNLWNGYFEAIIYPSSNNQIALILSDRTEKKKAEEELANSNKKMSVILDILSLRNKQVTLVNKMAESLLSCRTSDEAFLIIAQYGAQIFNNYNGALYIQEENTDYLSLATRWGGQIDSYVNSEKCWALRRGQIHIYPGKDIPILMCQHFGDGIGENKDLFSICIPLNVQGIFSGLFTINSIGEMQEDKLEEISELAKTISEQISMSIANIKLRESLQALSVRDPLTKLFNRRYLEESLLREISSAIRHKNKVSVVMTDIDHFKNFNDLYGHDAGDYVLKEFTNLISQNVRSEDIPCRFGGEEFVIILPGADMDTARQRAEIFREKFANLNMNFNGQGLGSVSASFGVACFPDNSNNSGELIKNADQALYFSKRNGRNRVSIYKVGL